MSELVLVPALTDNYIYVLHQAGITLVVDPGEAEPVLEALATRCWRLDYILNTHHHHDHTGGNMALKAATGAQIVSFAGDKHRIPGIDQTVDDKEKVSFGVFETEIFFIPGHTLGHIAYYLPNEGLLFCGDTLFSLGCGRLFEGTAEQMAHSLETLMQLPENTRICCGHEYTEQNGRFAASVDPDNEALHKRLCEVQMLRAEGRPTVPSTLKSEKACNPFLRALGGELTFEGTSSPLNAFTQLRQAKDRY